MGKLSEIHADLYSPTGYYGYPQNIGEDYDMPERIPIPEEVHLLAVYCDCTQELKTLYAYLDYTTALEARNSAQKLNDKEVESGMTYPKEYFIDTVQIKT